MAIHIYCTACYTSNGLDAKSCSNCGAPFGRDKKYRVCISIKGKRLTKVLPNLTLARAWKNVKETDLLRGDLNINQKAKKIPTLNELWVKYLPFAQENKKSWADDNWYYHKHLAPRFGDKPLDSISPMDIERLKKELREAGYAPATVKHQLAILRRVYNVARKWNLYDGKSPVESVEMPRLDNQVTEYLNGDELARLHKALDNWLCRESAAFIRLALFTGFRKGELLRLTWDAVDFERGMVTLREPKGGKTQTIPISEPALEVLKGLERVSPYVFPGPGGGQKTSFRKPWQKIKKAAGLPDKFRLHGLRHNFASYLVAECGLEVVGKLLTHKDYKTTQRYSHLAPGVLKEAAQRSGELLSKRVEHSEVIVIKPGGK